MSYERISIVGNIGAAEFVLSRAGNQYFRIRVAVTREASTVWYSVIMFGNMAKDKERLLSLYTKGRLVLIEGRPQVEPFIRKDGSLGLDNSIVAISMPELLDARPKTVPI